LSCCCSISCRRRGPALRSALDGLGPYCRREPHQPRKMGGNWDRDSRSARVQQAVTLIGYTGTGSPLLCRIRFQRFAPRQSFLRRHQRPGDLPSPSQRDEGSSAVCPLDSFSRYMLARRRRARLPYHGVGGRASRPLSRARSRWQMPRDLYGIGQMLFMYRLRRRRRRSSFSTWTTARNGQFVIL
jgi:hypothetical protein